MVRLMTFHSKDFDGLVHIHPDKFVGFMHWCAPGSKPGDEPAGVLLIVEGHKGGILVSDSYGSVVNTLRHAGMEV